MSKLKVNEIEKHNGTKITISDDILIGANSDISWESGGTLNINLANVDTITNVPANSISADALSGGTATNFATDGTFASGGIADTAGSTNVITLDANEDMILTADSNLTLSGTGSITLTGTSSDISVGGDLTVTTNTALGATVTIGSVAVQSLVPRAWWAGGLTITYGGSGTPVLSAVADNSPVSRYGLSVIPAAATTDSTNDTLVLTYDDASILDGTKSAVFVNIYNDADMTDVIPYSIILADATAKIKFLDPVATTYQGVGLTIKLSVMIMSLP